jgi:hypothetical protein
MYWRCIGDVLEIYWRYTCVEHEKIINTTPQKELPAGEALHI